MAKMITKLFAILMTVALCACLFVGCEESISKNYWDGSGFVYIESKQHLDYLYYEDTKVMYVYDSDAYRGWFGALIQRRWHAYDLGG